MASSLDILLHAAPAHDLHDESDSASEFSDVSSDVEVIRGEPSPPDAEVQPNADVGSESERSPVSPSDEQLPKQVPITSFLR